MHDVGIIIVTYNSEEEIGSCLDAAVKTGAEIVVVDNASVDGTLREVRRRQVRLLANEENRGFAAAVNQGFAAVEKPFVLLLNPDVRLESPLDGMFQASTRPNAAGAGGCLKGLSGRPQIGFMVRALPRPVDFILELLLLNRIWPDNPINTQYRGLKLDYSRCIPVGQPAGAFLMIRREVWQKLGGFDEGFHPLWFEDVDFCRRATDRGYRFYFEPSAVAKHTGGHTIQRLDVEMKRIYWYRNLLRYAAKHFRPAEFRLVCVAVILGSLLRLVAEAALLRSLKPLAVYSKVIRLAGAYFYSGAKPEAVVGTCR